MVNKKWERSNGLRRLIDEIIFQINNHPAVISGTTKLSSTLPAGGFQIECKIQIELPSKAYQCGRSMTGVMPIEPVTFVFSPEYPFQSPEILLRESFNINFPHLNPVEQKKGRKRIRPCVLYGDLV